MSGGREGSISSSLTINSSLVTYIHIPPIPSTAQDIDRTDDYYFMALV